MAVLPRLHALIFNYNDVIDDIIDVSVTLNMRWT
jgi:hypothetical protein